MENPTTYPKPIIMKEHDPEEDPFADLVDDSQNQMVSPLEYGSGAISPVKQQQQQLEDADDADTLKKVQQDETATNTHDASGVDDPHSNE